MDGKLCILVKIAVKSVTNGSIDNNIGSDNGLVLDRQQAIIWTNAYQIHWHI